MRSFRRETLGQLADLISSGAFLHCYLVTGADSSALIDFCLTAVAYTLCERLCGECTDCRRILSGNHTSVEVFRKEKFTVDDTAEIIYKSNLKAMEGGSKYLIISDAAGLNTASQNKLLKTLEEAPEGTHFFLCTARPDMLLPTVRSRAARLTVAPRSETEIAHEFEESAGIEKAALAAKYSGGSMSKAAELIKSPKMLDAVSAVDTLPERLRTSRDILSIAGELYKHKDNLALMLDAMEIRYTEMLNSRESELSSTALAYSIEAIIESKKKVNSNCSAYSVIDSLLFRILDVKRQYAHSSGH